MRRTRSLIVAAVLSATLFTGTGTAQTPAHAGRRVIFKGTASYPDLAKRMHVGGVVKLELIVRANGAVKSATILGGSPVLVQSASDAVQKWKFEGASQETTEVVQVVFELPSF
jgi:TonB family protein